MLAFDLLNRLHTPTTEESKQSNASANKSNHTVIEIPEEKPSVPPPQSASSYQLSNSHSFEIDDSIALEQPATSSSWFAIPPKFRPSPRMISMIQWFLFIAIHAVVFAWLLSIHLKRNQYGYAYIHQLFPIIAGLLLGVWVMYMVFTALRSPSQLQLPLILDPLLEAGGDSGINSAVPAAPSSSLWNLDPSGVNWSRYARVLFLTLCIGGEAFLLFIVILGRISGSFEGSAIQRIPIFLFLLVAIQNPFSWFMSYKFA